MEVQEIAQLLKGLPHELEDLNSVPRTQVKKGKGNAHLYPRAEKAATAGFQDLTGQTV